MGEGFGGVPDFFALSGSALHLMTSWKRIEAVLRGFFFSVPFLGFFFSDVCSLRSYNQRERQDEAFAAKQFDRTGAITVGCLIPF